MENIGARTHKQAQSSYSVVNLQNTNTEGGFAAELTRPPILLHSRPGWNEASAEWRAGEFYKGFSPTELIELESIATPYCCPGTTVLFAEEQEPYNVLFLLEGKVKLTMNSSGGRRLTLGIATPGDVLGLSAVVSGRPYEITAVAQFPCRIRAMPRKVFLDLLLRNPIAWQNSARQLGAEYKRGCEQLRILGFALTASMKLAMLLLQWCAKGQREGLGVRIHCSLTHEEIGEYIGVSRETISRSLIKFRSLQLVEQHGSVFLIPRIRALEVYVGQYGW